MCFSVDTPQAVTRDPAKAAPYGVKGVTDLSEALTKTEVNAVYVASPVFLHASQTLESLRAGKHVLCEKPMALTRQDAVEMFEAAERKGLKLIEGFPFRFQEQTRCVLDCVRGGEIGGVLTATACFAAYPGA